MEIIEAKENRGGNSANTWYLRGNTSRVIKCQATPGRELAERLKNILNPLGSKERVQVMEEGGAPTTAGLRVNDPFYPGSCRFGDPKCIVESGKDCGTMGIV